MATRPKRLRIRRPLGEKGVGPKRLTMTVFDDAEPIVPYGPGKLTREEVGKLVTQEVRIASIRAYRRHIDMIINWVKLGLMHPRDGLAAAQLIKVGAELLMTEKVMSASGAEDTEPEHPLGVDGGASVRSEAPAYMEVEIERETGTDPKGRPYTVERVVMTGGPALAESAPVISGPLPGPDAERLENAADAGDGDVTGEVAEAAHEHALPEDEADD